ncbi:MAG TPA: DUF6519 domain-containing protein, partial [Thermoanaerobaculia bacterium]|nr:DUF6519 domain-containing protein [Thermoanaerobaculia bacterium]
MPGDITRSTFELRKHYSGVRQQQGRVQLDADWNEQVDIEAHLRETALADMVGKTGAPQRGGGFKVESVGRDLTLTGGRIYVDGILLEQDTPRVPVLGASSFGDPGRISLPDKALEGIPMAVGDWIALFDAGALPLFLADRPTWVVQVRSISDDGRQLLTDPLGPHTGTLHFRRLSSYLHQPFLPAPALPGQAGTYVVYLDVWQRHVTAFEAPDLLEPALGGPDTATRTQTVWELKLVRIGDRNATGPDTLPFHCLSAVKPWLDAITPPSGRLRARTKPVPPPKDPCIVPSNAGYTRLENQLYRVEVHTGSNPGPATFKWSRENGSPVVAWLGLDGADPGRLRVASTGRDSVLGLAKGNWIELSDDTRELLGTPGALVKIKDIQGDVLVLDPSTSAPSFADFPLHPKARRWDYPDASAPGHNAADHALPIPTDDTVWVDLEGDIQVAFEPGTFHTGDYWLIPARAFIGQFSGDILWRRDDKGNALAEAPHGVAHHYAKLALVDFDLATKKFDHLRDCRPVFPALTEMIDFFLAGGDGQEAMPGQTLPCNLAVGVTNGRWSVEGARVRFDVETGLGTLQVPNGPSGISVEASTGADGLASCSWTLPATFDGSDTACFAVQATLLDPPWDGPSTPLFFHANRSIARQVAYDPGACTHLAGATTVQAALDRLCRNTSIAYVGGDGQEAGPGEMLP